MRLGLVTCVTLPEPDEDREPLLDALRARDIDARWVAWDDPGVDWRAYGALVLRSTWNYHHHLPGFLAWIDDVARTCRLFNDATTVRWNAHKGYLCELEARGVPVTPTVLLRRGEHADLAALLRARGWHDAVVKPAVSAASFGTSRVRLPVDVEAQRALDSLLGQRDVLVQPYLPSVEGHGERSLVFIDGELSHSVHKSPRFGDVHEAVSAALDAPADEREVASTVLGALPAVPLYARVDLARDDDGRPRLMELELIEPSLFLGRQPGALARFADAIVARVTSPRAADARRARHPAR